MFGYECFNCGMLPLACVCIEVCRSHRLDCPCNTCENIMNVYVEITDEQIISTCTVPFFKSVLSMLTLGLTDR